MSTPEEALRVVQLGQARADMADMRTLVIVGSSTTRVIAREGPSWVYTPRTAALAPSG
ncbi:MAG: hypothetical protein NVS2B4_20730 [Ramlibacter sp.]